MLEIIEIPISQLKPWEDNPRINDHAVAAVAKSIQSFGFNVPILCDQDFTIIAGHTRWKAAQKLCMTRVPVVMLDLKDSQRKAFAIADNKLGSLARWDDDLIRKTLEELKRENLDISVLGCSDREMDALLAPYREFNWAEFDQYLAKKDESVYGILQFKMTFALKEKVEAAIQKYALENRIAEKDASILGGKILCRLLGVNS